MNIPYYHINILKQLPKHGIAGRTSKEINAERVALEKLDAARKKQNKSIDEAKSSYENFMPSLTEMINLEAKLETVNKSRSITLNDLINQQTRFSKNVVNLSKKFLTLELRNKELNKAFGINFKQAGVLGKSYDQFAAKLGISGQSTRKYAQDLNKLLPGMQKVALQGADTGDGLLKIQTAFQQQLGLSGEVANNFIRLSGGSEEALTSQLELAKSLEETTGLQGLTRDLVADMANLAPQLQLQFSRIPGNLELAVLKARTLGTTFSEIASIGNKLLDIESSIGGELEYQLLSGKRLVDQNGKSLTQQFRQAAITGNANAQADALNKILESQGDTIENNVFARRKLAETLGIEESKLAGMVQQRRLLKKLGPEAEGILELQGEDLAKAVDKFKTENASLAGDLDALLKVADTRTTDEILIETLESLNASLAAGALAGLNEKGVAAELEAIRAGFLTTDLKANKEVTDMVESGNNLIKDISPILSVFQNTVAEFETSIGTLTSALPFFGSAVNKLRESLTNLTKGTITGNITGVSTPETPMTTIPVATSEKDAVVRVNDAVLFDPDDKINILASTSKGSLDTATNTMMGGNNNGPSAQEIGSAVAQALAGVKLYVSPNELAANMAFNSYNINA